jgi:predicted ATPase
VGAFRRQPERRYEYAGRPPNIIDPTGEHVISALLEDANRRGGGDLIKPVNRWLKEIGRVRLMPIRSIAKGRKTFEIKLRDTDSGRWANFADVGFGIGQALPVLVEGLRTPKEGTFLVQEPEIHLHPDAQLAMADFLVDLVGEGRRVIVETHSDPLLLRIRRRVLANHNGRMSKSKLKPSDVAIIHVSKTPGGASVAKSLKLDDLGQINDWPSGFMEETNNERLDLLTEMAEQAEK